MRPIQLNAVLFEENGVWIAHCLEYDFVSCAATLEDLPSALLRAIAGQIEADLEDGYQPFEGFRPAPRPIWDLYERVQREQTPIHGRSSEFPVEGRFYPVAA